MPSNSPNAVRDAQAGYVAARRRVTVVVIALLGLVTSCGWSGTQDPVHSEPLAPSELEQTLGFDPYSVPSGPIYERAIQESIAACMAEEGFEYPVAVTPPTPFEADRIEDDGTVDFAKRWGYGVGEQYRSTIEGESRPEDDPLQVAIATLSEPETDAFFETLDGTVDDESGEVLVAGCRHRAEAEQSGSRRRFAGTLAEQFRRDVTDRLHSDQRVVDLAATWSTCMATAGFDYDRPTDAYIDVELRFADLVGADDRSGATAGVAADTASDDRGAPVDRSLTASESEGDPSSNDGPTQGQFDELVAWEREVAVADKNCDAEHRIETALRDIRNEYEREFIDAYGDDLASVTGL